MSAIERINLTIKDLTFASGKPAEVAVGRVAHIIAVLVFRLALDIAYVFYVSPAFAGDPITTMLIKFSADRYLLSIVLLLTPAIFLPSDKRDLSGIYFMAAMIFLYIPMTSMIGLNADLPIEPSLVTLFAIAVSLVFVNLPLIPLLPMARNGERAAICISGAVVLLFIGWSIYSGAAYHVNFNLAHMYGVRETNSELLDVGIWAYINLWAEKIFNPLLFAIALYRRNPAMIVLTLIAQFYFFAVTQHRLHIFAPILTYMMYLLYKRSITLTQLYWYSVIGLLAVLVVSLCFRLDTFASISIRRALYVGASITIDWIDFFKNASKVYWTDRYLLGRTATEYTGVNLPYFMGHIKFPDTPFAFNVGMVGAGYSQAGIWGVTFYAALLGLIVNFVNRLIWRGMPAYIAAAILIGPLRTAWADSDLFTTLLSHGVIVAILLLALLGKIDEAPRQGKPLGSSVSVG